MQPQINAKQRYTAYFQVDMSLDGGSIDSLIKRARRRGKVRNLRIVDNLNANTEVVYKEEKMRSYTETN